MGKRLITAVEVREAAQAGQTTLSTPSDTCIVTPMAKDEAGQLGVVLNCGGGACPDSGNPAVGTASASSAQLIHQVADLLKERLPAGTPTAKLENIIREVVYAKIGQGADLSKPVSPSNDGVRFIDHQRLTGEAGGSLQVDGKMFVAEGVGGLPGEQLAGGYMIWENASFTRRVEQPEICVVLEGELHLDVDGDTLKGNPGDMVYLPKGAVVAYNAPKRVKLACVNCM